MRRNGILLCFVGPSGGGKTTYANKLLNDDPNFTFSVSLTTREPRPGEVNGKDYVFISKEEFQQFINNGELFEWEEVHGNFYGTRRSSIEEALSHGRDLLLDIDIKGAFSFKRGFPENTVVIFLTPPSTDVLCQRLKTRGKMSDEEFKKRLNTAQNEFSKLLGTADHSLDTYGMIDYFLVNNIIEETYGTIKQIVTAERSKFLRLNKDDVKDLCFIRGEI